MRYVVTGGAGFIGSHIADALVLRGDEVTILDNLISGREDNIRHLLNCPNVEFVHGSITNPDILLKVCKNADGIFHEAAMTSVPGSVKNPVDTNAINITGTLNVILAAQKCGVNKIVYASSSAIYGDTPVLPKKEDQMPHPQSPYAVTKLAGEYYLKVFGDLHDIKSVSLRYFNVFGPRQDPNSEYSAVIPKFIAKLQQHESPVIYGDGTQTRDFIFVKDVVQANLRAMDGDAEGVFNIACGNRINLIETAHLIMGILGEEYPLMFEPSRSGDVHDSVADISAARRTLGFRPAYTVKTGLEETIRWYRQQ
jgi:UDP-glucose 4-epimerase